MVDKDLLASHLIADEGWMMASSLAESFTRLEEHGVLSARTAEAMRNAVGFQSRGARL